MRTLHLFLFAAAVGAEVYFTSGLYAPDRGPTARLIAACTTPRTISGEGRVAPPECARPELASRE